MGPLLSKLSRLARRTVAASNDETLGGFRERTEAFRAGGGAGGGGGRIREAPPWLLARRPLVLRVRAGEVALDVSAVCAAASAAVSLADRLSWKGRLSVAAASFSLLLLLLNARLVRLGALGDVMIMEARAPGLGRLDGGGTGALLLTRRLDERERVESSDEREGVVPSSLAEEVSPAPGLGSAETDDLLSALAWLRLGGGSGFLFARPVIEAVSV